jgi:deazaflavin-dependent oxidoreductase (nitroreductase family)
MVRMALARRSWQQGSMAAPRRTPVLQLVWKVHPWLYRVTGGRVGGRMIGMPVLLLTTTGRRSGTPRTRALTYLPHGDAAVVIASNAGDARHPDWWLNLRANPEAEMMQGSRTCRIRAREADGDERARLWSAAVARWPGYAEYEGRTTRRIPVVVLEPIAGS